MTSSPPSSKPGSTNNTPGPTDGKSIQTTTSRTEKRPSARRGRVTLEEIEREFQKACEESEAPRARRRMQ